MSAAGLDLRLNEQPAASGPLHHAILTGFLGGIGVLDEDRTYLGARDARFVIAPGTPLRKRSPRWVVAASLVETQRLYARMVAQVQPSWIEAAGAHLVRRTYSEAQWVPERGMVMARETVSLYGRVLSSGRQVNFAKVDPATARRMFVEEALVRRQSALNAGFLERNQDARRGIERLEAKLRRRDLLAHDDVLACLLPRADPGGRLDRAQFRALVAGGGTQAAESARHAAAGDAFAAAARGRGATRTLTPGRWTATSCRCTTCSTRRSPDDGVTLTVPLPLLGSLAPEQTRLAGAGHAAGQSRRSAARVAQGTASRTRPDPGRRRSGSSSRCRAPGTAASSRAWRNS